MDRPPEHAVVARGSLPRRISSRASSFGRVVQAPKKAWRLFRPLLSKLAHKRANNKNNATGAGKNKAPGKDLQRRQTPASNVDFFPEVLARHKSKPSSGSLGRPAPVALFVTNERGSAVSRHNVVYPSGSGRGTPINHPMSSIPPNPWLHAFDDAQPAPPPEVDQNDADADADADARFMLRNTKKFMSDPERAACGEAGLEGGLEGGWDDEDDREVQGRDDQGEDQGRDDQGEVQGRDDQGEDQDRDSLPTPTPPPTPPLPGSVRLSPRHLSIPSHAAASDGEGVPGYESPWRGRARTRSAPTPLGAGADVGADAGADAGAGAGAGGLPAGPDDSPRFSLPDEENDSRAGSNPSSPMAPPRPRQTLGKPSMVHGLAVKALPRPPSPLPSPQQPRGGSKAKHQSLREADIVGPLDLLLRQKKRWSSPAHKTHTSVC